MIKDKAKVAVVMPAYNQANYISEALDSLLAQTFKDWECAVVDDGSPDNVAEIVKKYAESDSRIRFYHTENRGVSAARNYAAGVTSAPYILPLDADDRLHPEYLTACLEEFQKNPEARVVYGDWKFFGRTSYTPTLKYSGYRDLLMSNRIHCSGMYHREDFERIGGYDEKIPFGYEDWEFWIRMLAPKPDEEVPGQVIEIPRRLFFYRIKDQSRSADIERLAEQKRECFRYIYQKHSDVYNRFFPDMLSILSEHAEYNRRFSKWERRSLPSRLWHAITGKI